MIRLQTQVDVAPLDRGISLKDSIVILGSCFADNIGEKLAHSGFDVCVNPFGTLYNPVSVAGAVSRMLSDRPFTESECVEMGAGAGLICSFSHHTSFARPSAEEFLEHANDSLTRATEAWHKANKVIITLGTIYCFVRGNEVVANCLKRPAAEFERVEMTLEQVTAVLRNIVISNPDKDFIFTVSPIRHLADGAHGNLISKSTLILAVDELMRDEMVGQRCAYFPAYEIMMDELRDYRFYAEDMTHPSPLAVNVIWERFRECAIPASEHPALAENEKAWRRSQHRPMHAPTGQQI